MSERTPVNPHGFEEHKLQRELLQRNVELFDSHQADTRQRVDTLAKTIFVLSGGALTVSLGIFLRESAPPLTPEQLCVLQFSWWALFSGMAGFAFVVGIMIVQGFLIGEAWRAQLEGKNKEASPTLLKATVIANWVFGLPAFFAFIAGLGGLAWLASAIVGP